MELTEVEIQIIIDIRELKPYEKVTVSKDKEGKPDFYTIEREQKKFLKPKT